MDTRGGNLSSAGVALRLQERKSLGTLSNSRELNIPSLLSSRASATPGAIALAAPRCRPVTYRELEVQCHSFIRALNDFGIGRNDRIAMVLPDGLEMAAAFVAVTCGATCAPLNPAYHAGEFEFHLSDLNAKALLVMAGASSPARDVAAARGISILELSPASVVGRLFDLRMAGPPGIAATSSETGLAQPDDIALVLHTSGTTSRPKLVVLTQANLCTGVSNWVNHLRLDPRDRCLHVVPMFHMQGIGALLSSLSVGASVFCTAGFSTDFFDHLRESEATWFTAPPTMHQAILERAATAHDVIAANPLRFIRSAGAAMPAKVIAELEATFRVPAVEAYGMTEAASQISCNPLPPGNRKPGSVGIATGQEVVILDESGSRLPETVIGEIAIRGPNVTPGYENNSAANDQAFTSDGWFKTGDQGYLDSEGYLFITGRLKEMINRGGEKISPREIDEALLEHPDVAQAMAFAMPHPTLGEDVAAAVVLRPGAQATDGDIRQFLSAKLVYFKVPRRIVLLDDLPKGPSGKVQRNGLAQSLGVVDNVPPAAVQSPFVPARNPMEQWLVDLWQEVLQVKRVGINDNFFLLGGNSLTVTQVLSRIRQSHGIDVPIAAFFGEPTVAALSRSATTLPRAAPADFQRVLDDINSLSEEEAERLLQEEARL